MFCGLLAFRFPHLAIVRAQVRDCPLRKAGGGRAAVRALQAQEQREIAAILAEEGDGGPGVSDAELERLRSVRLALGVPHASIPRVVQRQRTARPSRNARHVTVVPGRSSWPTNSPRQYGPLFYRRTGARGADTAAARHRYLTRGHPNGGTLHSRFACQVPRQATTRRQGEEGARSARARLHV